MGLPLNASLTSESESLEEFLDNYLETFKADKESYSKLPASLSQRFPAVQASAVSPTFQMCVIRHILLTIEREILPKLMLLCTPETCPRMIASEEWHFLCAPHADKPRDCCAIDYMQHTVDSCSSTLLLVEGKQQSVAVKQYHSIVRRLFRIYGHVFFHHSEFFHENAELECGKFFLFLKQFGLWKADMGIIPEADLHKIVGSVGQDNFPQSDSLRSSGNNSARQSVLRAPPSVDVRSAGTIVDLRTVAMQLEEDSEDNVSVGSDRTIILN
jgi:hypothetical protein